MDIIMVMDYGYGWWWGMYGITGLRIFMCVMSRHLLLANYRCHYQYYVYYMK